MGEERSNARESVPSAQYCGGELCASILKGMGDAVFICSREGRLILLNAAFAGLFGRTEAELEGVDSAALRPLELAALALEQNKEVLADGRNRTFEFSVAAPGGLRTFEVTKGRCCVGTDLKGGVFGIVRDITESRAVERDLIDTSDREKQRLGRELRENFCQHLVGISLLGNVLFEELSKSGLEQANFAREIATLVKEVVKEVRTLEKGLSVTHLEQGDGLVDALRELAEEARAGSGIECVLEVPDSKPDMEPQTAMYLFRIAQEAVQNAVLHSQAHKLTIRLLKKRDAVVLSVRDDGIGLPKKSDGTPEAEGQIGFPIMHYRSRAIGAKLEIKNPGRGGVEVLCTVPRLKTGHWKNSPKRRPTRPVPGKK